MFSQGTCKPIDVGETLVDAGTEGAGAQELQRHKSATPGTRSRRGGRPSSGPSRPTMLMNVSEKNVAMLESPTWRAKCWRFVSSKEHGCHRTQEVRTLGTQGHVDAFPTVALQRWTRQLPRFRALGEAKPLLHALVVVLQVSVEKMIVHKF
jgi:hypothetical protein